MIRSLALLTIAAVGLTAAEPLKMGYSDYISFTAWEVAKAKGWFKEAGVDVDLVWFEYGPSIDAFQAGKIDAVNVASSDQLVMAGAGKKASKSIIITDYSNGNDKIIGKPGLKKTADLKGKKIGVEKGFVDHLLLLKALEAAGLKESDVEIVNMVTTDTPQGLASGSVDAVACWQPNANATLAQVPGSKAVASSADFPGLIYDVVAVSDESLAKRRDDWVKVAKVWDKVVAYTLDPATQGEAVKYMADKAGVDAEKYAKFLPGSKLHTLKENVPVLALDGKGLTTLVGSLAVSDAFNREMKVYEATLKPADFVDGSVVADALK